MRLTSSPHKNYSFKILAFGEAMAQKWTKTVQKKNLYNVKIGLYCKRVFLLLSYKEVGGSA
jgi:hypothetical protein